MLAQSTLKGDYRNDIMHTSIRKTKSPGWTACVVALATLSLGAIAQANDAAAERPLFELDEATWAMFYDLPSRRFRSIRDAFIRKDLDAASRDLQTSIGFLSIEAGRAVEGLLLPLSENVEELQRIQGNIADVSVTVGALDSAFARAHWLLAQHYLMLSLQSRDTNRHKMAGHYLWATAHHLERAVLWSDARIDRATVSSLESIRKLGQELQTSSNPQRVYRQKPVAAAAKTLVKIGEHLNRKVWIQPQL